MGQSPQAVLKAVDKMIVMGAAMDGAALQEAAKAHVKAIDGMDAKGVLSQADFEAINAGLGRFSVYSCRGLAICFVAGVCLMLKRGHRSRALIAFARSLGRAVWKSCAVFSFGDEQLGWTS